MSDIENGQKHAIVEDFPKFMEGEGGKFLVQLSIFNSGPHTAIFMISGSD